MDRLKIKNKKVYVVDNHHEVLEAWAEYRRNLDSAPELITIDYHTDTHKAFICASYDSSTDDINKSKREELISGCNFNNVNSIINSVKLLRHDEHICAACDTDIIDKAYIVAHESYSHNEPRSDEEIESDKFYEKNNMEILFGITSMLPIQRPYHYSEKSARIFIPSWSMLADNLNFDKDDFNDIVVDDRFLTEFFKVIYEFTGKDFRNEMCLLEGKYILDIDLDAFTSDKSLQIENHNIFYKLIKNAGIITIAREKDCVELCSRGVRSADDNYAEIIKHIEAALDY